MIVCVVLANSTLSSFLVRGCRRRLLLLLACKHCWENDRRIPFVRCLLQRDNKREGVWPVHKQQLLAKWFLCLCVGCFKGNKALGLVCVGPHNNLFLSLRPQHFSFSIFVCPFPIDCFSAANRWRASGDFLTASSANLDVLQAQAALLGPRVCLLRVCGLLLRVLGNV